METTAINNLLSLVACAILSGDIDAAIEKASESTAPTQVVEHAINVLTAVAEYKTDLQQMLEEQANTVTSILEESIY